MSEPTMAGERPNGTPEDVASKDQTLPGLSPDASQPVQPASHPNSPVARHSFINVRGVLSREGRQKARDERAARAEDQFGTDTARMAVLVEMNSDMDFSRLDEVDQSSLTSYPVPEDALIKYGEASEKDRGNFKNKVRVATEKTIKGTMLRLTTDLKTLYFDRGASLDETDQGVRSVTEGAVNGKRKQFGHLDKDGQMQVLNNAHELRSKMLRGNMVHYLYYLSAYQDGAGLDDDKVGQMRERFASSDEENQAKMAAAARRNVVRAMGNTVESNIDRLQDMELISGKHERTVEKEMEELRLSYNLAGTLRQKDKIIERLLKRKEALALPHLQEIVRFRAILERDEHIESAPLEHQSENDDRAQLREEVARIDELLVARLAVDRGSKPLSELTFDDMEKEVTGLVQVYEDPSLVDTFQWVRLLQANPSEIF